MQECSYLGQIELRSIRDASTILILSFETQTLFVLQAYASSVRIAALVAPVCKFSTEISHIRTLDLVVSRYIHKLTFVSAGVVIRSYPYHHRPVLKTSSAMTLRDDLVALHVLDAAR